MQSELPKKSVEDLVREARKMWYSSLSDMGEGRSSGMGYQDGVRDALLSLFPDVDIPLDDAEYQSILDEIKREREAR